MLASGQIWRRDVYPLVDWAVIPVPTVQLFGGNDGFKPQLTAQFRGSVSGQPGLSFSTLIRQPVLGVFDDPGPEQLAARCRRSAATRRATMPAGSRSWSG